MVHQQEANVIFVCELFQLANDFIIIGIAKLEIKLVICIKITPF